MSLNLTIVNSSTPSGMSDFQVISAIIVLCALVLGIANAYFHWKDKQPNIKVDAYEFVDSAHSLTSDPERVTTIRGYNSGQIPITISSYSFFIPSKKIGHSIGKPYSTRVLPGAYCERWEYSDKIAKVLQPRSGTIKIIACLIDESGRWYKSDPFEFDIDQALKGTKGKKIWTREELGMKTPMGRLDKIKETVRRWHRRKYDPPDLWKLWK